MRFVIYKNSILATFCSMFGASMIAMAVMALINGELDFLPGIGVLAIGIGLMWLAGIISERKARRKQAKAAQAVRAAAHTTRTSTASSAAVKGDSRNSCPLAAGILFLFVALLTLWAVYLDSLFGISFSMNSETVMLIGMGVLLLIAVLRTRHIREVSVLFALGFLALALGSIDVAVCRYRDYSAVGYSSEPGTYLGMIASHLLRAAGYSLMTVFALFSMRNRKMRFGAIVSKFWFVPIPVLLVAFAKDIGDNSVLRILEVSIINGFDYPPRHEFLEVIAQFCAILAVFLTGLYFRRICQNNAAEYARPEPRPAAPAAPVQSRPAQPQPEPRRTVSEPPKQTEQVTDPDVQKKIQAYKDLLDCGILSQEEYDQKIRELTRG